MQQPRQEFCQPEYRGQAQGTAEGHAFRRDELDALLALAHKGINELMVKQREALA